MVLYREKVLGLSHVAFVTFAFLCCNLARGQQFNLTDFLNMQQDAAVFEQEMLEKGNAILGIDEREGYNYGGDGGLGASAYPLSEEELRVGIDEGRITRYLSYERREVKFAYEYDHAADAAVTFYNMTTTVKTDLIGDLGVYEAYRQLNVFFANDSHLGDLREELGDKCKYEGMSNFYGNTYTTEYTCGEVEVEINQNEAEGEFGGSVYFNWYYGND